MRCSANLIDVKRKTYSELSQRMIFYVWIIGWSTCLGYKCPRPPWSNWRTAPGLLNLPSGGSHTLGSCASVAGGAAAARAGAATTGPLVPATEMLFVLGAVEIAKSILLCTFVPKREHTRCCTLRYYCEDSAVEPMRCVQHHPFQALLLSHRCPVESRAMSDAVDAECVATHLQLHRHRLRAAPPVPQMPQA